MKLFLRKYQAATQEFVSFGNADFPDLRGVEHYKIRCEQAQENHVRTAFLRVFTAFEGPLGTQKCYR